MDCPCLGKDFFFFFFKPWCPYFCENLSLVMCRKFRHAPPPPHLSLFMRFQGWQVWKYYVVFVCNIRAVYTGIKNPEFSHIPVFHWKLLGNYPLTLQKARIEKPTSKVWFFETPPVFHWFFANVNACSPLTGIIRVFSHVGRDLLRNHPARDVLRTTYGQR